MLGVLTLATFSALPACLACELLLRRYFLPARFELVRAEFEPTLTPASWVFAALTAFCSPVALRFARRTDERDQSSGRVVGFALASSVSQVPALLATLALFFGARPLPAVVAVVISSATIVALYLRARR